MQVTISATSIGNNAGPFNITDNLSNTVATGVTRSQILAGYVATVNDSATSLNLTSTGVCTNTTNIGIVLPSPTPTVTVTPSLTPAPSNVTLVVTYVCLMVNSMLT